MKKIVILYHPMKDEARALSKTLEQFLKAHEITALVYSAWEAESAVEEICTSDLVMSVGGDGTIMRAAHAVLPGKVPIIGVNLGKLGFLAELSVKEALEKMPALLEGKGQIEERSVLEADITDEQGEKGQKFTALNDVVVARGSVARLISIRAYIDGELVTNYQADGVIVATATGSTAYSMAAGGPVLHPLAKESVMVPILPHLCLQYALVVPAEATVKLQVNSVHPATLSIDGVINLPVSSGATITVRRSEYTVRFLRLHRDASFYGTLEQKLQGKKIEPT